MKQLEEFVLEKLKVSKIKAVYHPNSKEELVDLIIKEIETNGPNCSLNHIDVSNIDDMSFIFNSNTQGFLHHSGYQVLSKFNGDISNWDVSNVKNMRGMFQGSSFNGDISEWDVSNVKDMSYMFNHSNFNEDISNWDISNVTNMNSMFERSSFNGDISGWDVSNVTDMRYMFKESYFNRDISKWDVSNIIDMTRMFAQSKFNGDISKWKINTKSEVNMYEMFKGSPLQNNLPKWYK